MAIDAPVPICMEPTANTPPLFIVSVELFSDKTDVFVVPASVVTQSTPVVAETVLLQLLRVTVGPQPGKSPELLDEQAANAGV